MDTPFFTPAWVKNAVFYQIFPDRFAKSSRVEKPHNLEPWDTPPSIHGYKGGDLLGVAEHLDYLADLGINAIYLNPIFQSASNHRYHTHDYYLIDPLLGGAPAFQEMLAVAHQRGIRVVLDGVFNHASRGFFQFNQILEDGEQAPYLDWFTVHSFPVNAYSGQLNYEAWVNLRALPKFNFNNPQVRAYILGVARFWLEQGIDGWRLDVPYEIRDEAFWQDFRRLVKSINPEAYIVGEIAWEAQPWLQGDQFDAVMNYQFTVACLGFFGGEGINWAVENNMMGLPRTPILEASAFARRVEQLLKIYPTEAAFAQLNLLDSHDMPRFITLVNENWTALRLAVLFQMTYPGAPCVYYGDEIGMQGGMSNYPEASRSAFPWDPSRWDQDILSHFKNCIALRHAFPALRVGQFTSLFAEGQVYIYQRRLEDEVLLVAINNGPDRTNLALPSDAYLPAGMHWESELSEAGGQLSSHAGIHLPPKSGLVLAARA